MPHPLRFESKKRAICVAWVWNREGTEKLVNGKQHSVWFVPTGMKGLPQNVLLNFRLEFPKSDLTIYLPSGISEIFCQMVSTVVHLKRWTSFLETFPVGPNRSIEFWTEISGNFVWMDCAPDFSNARYFWNFSIIQLPAPIPLILFMPIQAQASPPSPPPPPNGSFDIPGCIESLVARETRCNVRRETKWRTSGKVCPRFDLGVNCFSFRDIFGHY